MRRRSFIACFGVLLASLALFGVRAGQAQEEEPDRWIVVGDGNPGFRQGVGLLLIGLPDGPRTISPFYNSVTQASGSIGTGPECPHGDHFHGSIFGKSDDGEGCGWGAVIPAPTAPAAIRQLSGAVGAETRVLLSVDETPPDYAAALEFLEIGLKNLRKAKQSALIDRRRGRLSGKESDRIQDKFRNAERRDIRARTFLRRLASGNGRPGDVIALEVEMKKALKDKRDAVTLLARGLGLLEDE